MAHIQEDDGRTNHSNSKTLMTEKSIKAAAKTVCQDIKAVWRDHFSSSLIDGSSQESIIFSDTKILKMLSNLVSEWKELEKIERRADRKAVFDRKLKSFQEKMKVPFNIAKTKANEIIDKSKIIEKEAEKIHLKQQLSEDQPGTIAGVDKRQQKKELRIKKSQESYERRRSEAFENNNEQADADEADDEDDEDDEDESNNEKPSSSRPRKRKINIMGPISLAADGRGISLRDRTIIAAETMKAAGLDINDTNISVGSATYHAKKSRAKLAEKLEEDWRCPSHVTLHWDTKMVEVTGSYQKSNRCCVVLRGCDPENLEIILAIPEIKDGKGKTEAEAVINVLKGREVKVQVLAVVFDTTSTNTSAELGACKFIEEYVGRPVLWVACRHHIAELVVTEAYLKIWNIKTTGPKEPMCEKLRKEWVNIKDKVDYSKLQTFDSSSLPESLRPLARETLDFCLTEYHRGTFPRADYRELCELAIICLGGEVEKFQFRLPGPVHHARWMALGIYFLKMHLLGDLFGMTDSEKEKVRRLVTFILLVYIRFWFRTPLSTAAPRIDLQLYRDTVNYREIEPAVAFQVLHKIRLHLWYLTPRLVVLALCDKGLEEKERKNIALSIWSKVNLLKEFQTGKQIFPSVGWDGDEPPAISSFITEESWLLFKLCGIKTSQWLMALYHLPCSLWGTIAEYAKFESVVTNMAVLNDSGERALSMMDKFYNKIVGDSAEKEKERQDLLQVVQHYRRENPDLLKATLAKK